MFQLVKLGEETKRFCNSCEAPARVRLVTCTPDQTIGPDDGEERPIAAGVDFCRPCARTIGARLERAGVEPKKRPAKKAKAER